ncbi:MAG: hypothetical protein HWE11_13115, partial [Gammaproteobacteria bacterium]|nr:hypothetical protein [Gammaproteobacteria bacterium]
SEEEPLATEDSAAESVEAISEDTIEASEPAAVDHEEELETVAEPSADQESPSADQESPSADQESPSAIEESPSASEESPSADQESPSVEGDESSAEEDRAIEDSAAESVSTALENEKDATDSSTGPTATVDTKPETAEVSVAKSAPIARKEETPTVTASDKLKAFIIKVDNSVRYFIECYREDKKGALAWWWKTNAQNEALKDAIKELSNKVNQDNFTLDKIWTTLSDFTLRPEDISKLKWFEDAHDKIISVTTQFKTGKTPDRVTLQKLQNQLRFIANSEDFCQKFGLEKARKEVFRMYKDLTNVLNDLKKVEREKLAMKENEQKLEAKRLAKEKAEAELKKEKAALIKEKETRLKAVEEKKKAIAFKQAQEAERVKEERLSELRAQEAEKQRQLQLQSSFVDMQVQDRLKLLSVKELAVMLNSRVLQSDLSDDDKSTLNDLKDKLNHL